MEQNETYEDELAWKKAGLIPENDGVDEQITDKTLIDDIKKNAK